MSRSSFILMLHKSADALPPTLNALTLSNYAFRVDAAQGAIVATISGKAPGSTLTLSPDDQRFELTGNDTDGWTIVRGETDVHTPTETVDLVETLDGYVNSPRSTTVIFNVADTPTEGNLYLGALTPNGYGAAFGETYAGTGYLKVEDASDNGMLKLRYNGANNLVFGTRASTGSPWPAVTTTPVTPVDLEDVYTFYAVEYSDAACTVPTGNSWPRTLYTRADYVRPEVQVPVGTGADVHTLASITIPLAQSRFAVEWLRSDDPRYVAAIAARPGDMLPASGTNNQIRLIQAMTTRLLGQYLVLCPGGHNEPYVSSSFPNGTVDFDVQPAFGVGNATVNTVEAFGGTAPAFEDANWYHIVQIDPANTRMGYLKWSSGGLNAFTRLHDNYIMRTRASLIRTTGARDATSGSAQGCVWINAAMRYVRIDGNAFDMDDAPVLVDGVAAPRYANSIYSPGGTSAGYGLSIENNTFGRGYYTVNVQNSGSLLGEHVTIKGNKNTGEHQADVCHVSNWYNMHIAYNIFRDRRFYGGIHPDFFQLKTSSDALIGNFPFGEVEYNVVYLGVDNPEASGQAVFLNQQAPDTWWVGGRIAYNLIIGHKQNAIAMARCDGTLVEHNTIQCDITVDHSWVPPKGGKQGYTNNVDVPLIGLNASRNCTVRNNVVPNSTTGVNNSDDGLPSGVSNSGVNAATNTILSNRGGVRAQEMGVDGSGTEIVAVSAGPYSPTDAFAAPVYGSEPSSVAAAVAAYKAKADGPLVGAGVGGSTIGVWDTDGSYA